MSNLSLLLFVFLLCAACCEAQSAVEITAEPSHHLALENDYIRVFKVDVAPHATTLVHWHRRDYIYVVIGAADITNAVEGKPPANIKFQDGQVMFVAGSFAHKATNNGATPFRNVTIELKKNGTVRNAPEERGLDIGSGAAIDTVFIKDGIRVRDITLNPGATLPSHTHKGAHLVVAVTDLELESKPANAPTKMLHVKTGDFQWVPPSRAAHTVQNHGAKPARFITLEYQ
jgi:oxalate decarboxylase/phosphoglucose isomerase-like protein (cupin superfamily)